MMYPGREERAVAVLKLWLHEKGGGACGRSRKDDQQDCSVSLNGTGPLVVDLVAVT